MSKRIIDLLESIEIDEEDSEWASVLVKLTESSMKGDFNKSPVRKLRQLVEKGHSFHFLDLPPRFCLGSIVAKNLDSPDHISVGTEKRLDTDYDRNAPALLMAEKDSCLAPLRIEAASGQPL